MQVKELEKHIPNYAKLHTETSTSNIGWHVEHCLLVYVRIITAMESSDPALYKGSFNMKKILVFALNKIPRGKAQAPKTVRPTGEISPEKLMNNIEAAGIKIKALANLQKHHHFDHPFFGKLHLKETVKFLKIHTHHHLKIINDIVKAV